MKTRFIRCYLSAFRKMFKSPSVKAEESNQYYSPRFRPEKPVPETMEELVEIMAGDVLRPAHLRRRHPLDAAELFLSLKRRIPEEKI